MRVHTGIHTSGTLALAVMLWLNGSGSFVQAQQKPSTLLQEQTPAVLHPDTYTDLSLSCWHALALRVDGTVATIGMDGGGKPPDNERFRAVAGGFYASFAIRSDGTLYAWGMPMFHNLDVPKGVFKAVAAGTYHGLGLRLDGTLVHWGNVNPDGRISFGLDKVPAGRFKAIASKSYTNVALREDGTLVGWGYAGEGLTKVPSGKFIAVEVGLAIREDGTLAAWGNNSQRQEQAPSGKFKAISVNGFFCAAIREDGTLAVWGRHPFLHSPLPNGRFVAVAAASETDNRVYLLALREDNTLYDSRRD